MDSSSSTKTDSAANNNKWFIPALSTAVIAGTFCLVVCLLLTWNFLQGRPDPGVSEKPSPLDSQYLAQLKTQLAQNPKDEKIKQQIRQLDLDLRRQFFRRQNLADQGGLLLFVGGIVFLAALKITLAARPQQIIPPSTTTDHPPAQLQAQARRAVITTALIIIGTLLALLLTTSNQPPPLATAISSIKSTVTPSPSGQSEKTPAPHELTTGPPEKTPAPWPRFRGPNGLGICTYANIPTKWNGTTGQGILWKSPEIKYQGHNSPIIWNNRVFLSGADENRRMVYCFDGDTGKIIWQEPVPHLPSPDGTELEEAYEDTGYAAPTMATNGQEVFALFATGDLAAFDFEGRKLWAKNLGTPDSVYGFSTSLMTYKDRLIVQYDQGESDDEKSKLFAIAGFTGEVVWEITRGVANSWTSPILIEQGGAEQIITCSDPLVAAYNPLNGKEIWRAEIMGSDVAPSPVWAKGMVIVAQPWDELYAIRADGVGDVTETHIAWSADEGVPDICSPVSNGELVFLLSSDGTLTCYETAGGAKLWEHDFDEECLSSPTIVVDKIYVLCHSGVMFIAAAGREFALISQAELGEKTTCSPAFCEGRIYIRGEKHLYGIGNK
ncbi:MAG: PQQ-like beta-propeller repeat protein [Sedimentisphaerales bacterium]|nr:PQQ-like beta-propeller repeat protein [Sedimentisphaerales bacterium]